jgi:hypothetical protein
VAYYFHGTIQIRRSTDGGVSFGDPVAAAEEIACGLCPIGGAAPEVRPVLAVSSNGTVFMAVSDARKEDPHAQAIIRLFRSTDEGETWTETWQRDSGSGYQDFFANVVVTPDDSVHVTFLHSNHEEPCYYREHAASEWIVTSHDNGETFGPARKISVEFSTNSGNLRYFEAGAAASYTDNVVFPPWTDHRENHPAPYTASMVRNAIGFPGSWTMTSIPSFLDSYNKANVYPGVTSNQIFYNSPTDYVIAPDPLKDSIGYWVKFPTGVTTHSFLGTWKDEMVMPVFSGWNIIGSISAPIDTASVIKSVPGLVISSYFDYNGGYSPVATLTPGRAFWVHTSQAGTLTLRYECDYGEFGYSSRTGGLNRGRLDPDDFVVVDSTGFEQHLWVVSDGDRIEMPPDPPAGGGINVRFASGKFQEVVRQESGLTSLDIGLHRVRYPVRFKWRTNPANRITYWIKNGNTRTQLDTAGSFAILSRTDGFIRLEARSSSEIQKPLLETLPIVFDLKAAFPNPFNPQTNITYDLPEDARVELVVYNTLGQEVARLVDEVQTAGHKSTVFDASSLPSGVYFYRMNATGIQTGTTYTKVMKMLLVR